MHNILYIYYIDKKQTSQGENNVQKNRTRSSSHR